MTERPMTLDALEQALRAGFDPEVLSVYSDHLQSIGDPRGELIALELAGSNDTARRSALIERWLGNVVSERIAQLTIEHGFISDVYLDGGGEGDLRLLWALLRGPGAPYLRGVTLRGTAARLRELVVVLATRVHDWMTRLSLQRTDEPRGDPSSFAPGDGAGGRAQIPAVGNVVMRVAPRLTELEVWGTCVLGDVVHPSVRSLRITGYRAIGSLNGRGPAWPSVNMLDLALVGESDEIQRDSPGGDALHAAMRTLLPVERLPRLRQLDLSRNEPGQRAPHYLGGNVDVVDFLSHLDVRRQLRQVRLPSLRTASQAARVASLAELPGLRELAVARHHERHGVAPPPRVTVLATWPWPPADACQAVLHARIVHAAIPDTEEFAHSIALELAAVIVWLEDVFDALPAVVRKLWLGLFASLRQHPQRAVTVPARALRAMLGQLDPQISDLDGWIELRDMLRGLRDELDGTGHVVLSP